jgi:hypothetical protein
MYDNWQSIFEALPDALNAQRHNGRSPANSDQKSQYSPEAVSWAAAYTPRGPERGTPVVTSASHLNTKSQRWVRVLQRSLCRWQLQALQPVLAAWLPDCPEYSDLHHLEQHVCFWCDCTKNELGDYVPLDKQHPQQDHNLYRTLSDANAKAADAKFLSRHVHREVNMSRHNPGIVSDLPKPKLLYTMQIGMLNHLQKWIFIFMKTQEGLNKYNAISFSVPAYHSLTPKTKSYEEVSQWNGKEMKEMSRYLLGVVTQSLRGASPTQCPIFNHAIECTRALLEFYMYAQYKSHDNATLSYMGDALCRFHAFKDVFLLGWAGKKAKDKPNVLRTELVKKQKVDEETHAHTSTPSKKRREMNTSRDCISHEVDGSKELDADFKFPKINLMAHWVEQIRRSGPLQQYSAERQEQAHKTKLKDGWNASNQNLNYLPQAITIQRRILCSEIKELNLPTLAQRRENSAATCKVLPSGADLATPLSSQSYAKPEFMGPQNRRDGKHPDAMIKDCRAWLDNTQDTTHRVTIYNGTREFPKHKSRNKTYISDEQLHAIELSIYHGIKVQVEGLDGERISQIYRCSGSQRWRRRDRRNEWVWVKQRRGRSYGALNGRLPWQLQRLFKIKLLNKAGTFVEYWLALALTAVPENSGSLDPVSKFVQLRNAPAAVALQVFSVGYIVGYAHVNPEIAPHSKTGDGRNERWIINSHIYLTSWNDVYNEYREICILREDRRNARRRFSSVIHRIWIPFQGRAQWTHSDVWSQLAFNARVLV